MDSESTHVSHQSDFQEARAEPSGEAEPIIENPHLAPGVRPYEVSRSMWLH